VSCWDLTIDKSCGGNPYAKIYDSFDGDRVYGSAQ
jgi:hypothetical protein